jgi:hypothetical protein
MIVETCPHCSASDCWHDCVDCECADRDDYGHYYDGIPQGYYVRETLDGEELVRTTP